MHTVRLYGLSVNSWIRSLSGSVGFRLAEGKQSTDQWSRTCPPTTLLSKPFLLTWGTVLTFCEGCVTYRQMQRFWCVMLTQFRTSCLLSSPTQWGAGGDDGDLAPLVSSWNWRGGTEGYWLLKWGGMRIRDWGTVDVQHPLTFLCPLPWFCAILALAVVVPSAWYVCKMHCCHGSTEDRSGNRVIKPAQASVWTVYEFSLPSV